MPTPTLLQRLKEQKLVQWAVAYLAGALWVCGATRAALEEGPPDSLCIPKDKGLADATGRIIQMVKRTSRDRLQAGTLVVVRARADATTGKRSGPASNEARFLWQETTGVERSTLRTRALRP